MPQPHVAQFYETVDPTAEAEVDMADTTPRMSAEPEPTTGEPDRASLARALRDLEAAKARVERDARASAQELREKLVLELVPVLDNLDRTIRAAEQAGDAPSVLDGVMMVRDQFLAVLRRMGVERVEARGRKFDPKLHDAVSVVNVHQPVYHDVIVDQLEPGYRFDTRLLRPAKVVVGRYVPRFH
jgi:molecular chaperone GrpE (heat shock protein)